MGRYTCGPAAGWIGTYVCSVHCLLTAVQVLTVTDFGLFLDVGVEKNMLVPMQRPEVEAHFPGETLSVIVSEKDKAKGRFTGRLVPSVQTTDGTDPPAAATTKPAPEKRRAGEDDAAGPGFRAKR